MDQTKKEKSEVSADAEILRIARERFDLAEEAWQDIRDKGLDDLKFRAGDQWPESVKKARESDFRPCLVINRIPQFIRQVTNDQRQNRPSIKVFPVDDKGDIETAKVLQGMIRHIEYNSNADVAYDTAFEGAATKGFGFWRVTTDYVDPMSFEQEILIKRIRNHFSVSLDPHSKEPDGSDANWAFVFEDIPKDDYLAEYEKSDLATMTDWDSTGNELPGWITKSSCRIAEYFYKDFKKITLVLLSNGQVTDKEKLTPEVTAKYPIESERETVIPVIKWCKINGVEVLEKTDWPGRWIPIIPVLGDELDIDGKRVLEGVVRHAKDSQRMYNYWASTETETIALAPKAPFIVAEGQIPPEYAEQWKTANSKNHSFLPYKPTSIAGQPVGPPQRNTYEAPIGAITSARMGAAEDMKATTGIYDAALGNRSNENSGIAIQRRSAQSQTSNFHLMDNLTRSQRHTGRILIDLIPKIYDTNRAARILGEDGEQEIVQLNAVFEKGGEQKMYNLSAGKYDVAVDTGPSYATKRQESLASMIDLTRAYPQVAQVAADLMVKNMDWPGAQEISERLKKILPPGMIEEKDKKPLPPEVTAQMQQMGKMIDDLTASLNQSNEIIRTKSIEIESKERIEFAKLKNQAEIKLAELGSREAIELLAHQVGEINNRLGLLDIHQQFDEDPFQQQQDFNESGPEQAAIQDDQQPTGGLSPGNNMGV